VGKEFKVFSYRIESIYNLLKQIKLRSKYSGAVGSYNCHVVAYPKIDWISLTKEFIESMNLDYNPLTTQIESHDILCLLLSHIKIINNIIKDLNSDMWLYISRNYFTEKTNEKEVGSSVMPHKVNPINHENSMANIEICNSIIDALVNNLSISRMQRDLTDSSKLRNLGVILSHSLISINQSLTGLNKIIVNKTLLKQELNDNYIVLSEAIQTVLRKNKIDNAYELLKELSRGKIVTKDIIINFINTLPINDEDKKNLLKLTPEDYIGLSTVIVENN
jgi:adenylosuccinate lyase